MRAVFVAPRRLRFEGLVDGWNRRVPADRLSRTYAPAISAHKAAGHADRLLVEPRAAPPVTEWLAVGLRE